MSANPVLNSNPGFCISFFICLFGINFSLLFGASNNQILDKENKTEFFLWLSDLKPDFTLTLGYLKPALNKPALGFCELRELKKSTG